MAPVVATRARRVLDVFPAGKLILSTDCGFGRQGFDRTVAFYKTTAIAQARYIVVKEIGLQGRYVAAADPVLQTDVLPDRGPLTPPAIAVGLSGGVRSVGRRVLILGSTVLLATACSLGGGMLGGREKCWPESEQRAASIWRGILRIDASGGRLDTPEGDVIPLLPGALATRVGEGGVGELVRGGDVVARGGDDVTLFGGAGADGALVVCAVEEMHAPA